MKILVNERLSQHKSKTPEGYLICTDAILARTGKQTYKKNEIFADSDDESEIEVDRTEDEVFSPKTLASFENKPVTVEHPDEDVNVHNYKDYAVGFVRDVRRGKVDGQDVILGNLVITDEETIKEIEDGQHTELSCGYDCDIVDEDNPCQRNIRGNHVALCEQGRAGIAKIVDSNMKDDEKANAIRKIKLMLKNPDNVHEDYEGVQYLTQVAYREISDIAHKAGLTRKDMEEIDPVMFGRGGYYTIADAEDKKVKYAVDKHGREFKLVENKDGSVIASNQSGRIKEFASMKKAEEEFRSRGITILDDFLDSTNACDIVDEEKYVVYADGTWHNSRALFAKKIGPAAYSTEANADTFTKEEAESRTKAKGKYDWKMKNIGDSVKDDNTYSTIKNVLNDLIYDKNYEIEDALIRLYKYMPNAKASTILLALESLNKPTGLKLIRSFGFKDSIRDVKPRAGESKNEFISRFMRETKNEYPDEKQRLAVAYSYWKGKDSVKDGHLIDLPESFIREFEDQLKKYGFKMEGKGRTFLGSRHYQVSFDKYSDLEAFRVLQKIDDWCGKQNVPMTMSVGGGTAGIDLREMYVNDSIKDAKKVYTIRWTNLYALSKGYGKEYARNIDEIKASSLKEALEELAYICVGRGCGTLYCQVISISTPDETYTYSGRLSDLLKKVKDSKIRK